MFVIDTNKQGNNATSNSQNNLMTKESERQYYTENLDQMCRMLFCADCGCWHVCLELVLSNPFSNYQKQYQIPPYMNSCPHVTILSYSMSRE